MSDDGPGRTGDSRLRPGRRAGPTRVSLAKLSQQAALQAVADFVQQAGLKLDQSPAASISQLEPPHAMRCGAQGQHGAKYLPDGREIVLRDPESQCQQLGTQQRLGLEHSQDVPQLETRGDASPRLDHDTRRLPAT